ncbi:hypothetical protein ACH82I_07090 [Brevibacterium sp. GP-SGM9]|uniref:hypothetical protein n=1 Tax=Brevibacterium sp. GP-SGM9 TaxID=3376990 RepID=UPI0039A72152
MDTKRALSAEHRRLRLLAQVLPLVTVAAWIITIFVPVLDSRTSTGPGIVITSLGDADSGGRVTENPGFAALWLIILAIAALAWVFRAPKWWSGVAIIVAALLLICLMYLVIEPPFLMWDGQTPGGRPTGGMEVAYPGPGFIFWILGVGALGTAGFCGLIAEDREAAASRCVKTGT